MTRRERARLEKYRATQTGVENDGGGRSRYLYAGPILAPIAYGPPCPRCGAATKQRTRRAGRPFYGCRRWPICQGKFDTS